MKLGLLTAAFPDTPLTEVADWAAANGFSTLEVACWPRAEGADRRYAGVSHIDCANLGDVAGQGAGRRPRRAGHRDLRPGLLPEPAAPRPGPPGRGDRPPAQRHLAAAAEWACPVVNTFIGADQHKPWTENFEDVHDGLAGPRRHAADHGVKIGIENCPMIFSRRRVAGRATT